MALKASNFPTSALCDGEQWYVADRGLLVACVASVLVGRVDHVEAILAGAEARPKSTSAGQKAALKRQLVLPPGADKYHRDGLLFETICWIAAVLRGSSGDRVSLPHRKSTEQGADIIQVSLDEASRTVVRATIFEQKCTTNARKKFRDEVLPAFKEWLSGSRDAELLQATLALLEPFELTDDEKTAAAGRIVNHASTAVRAAITVSPDPYDGKRCSALFKNYDDLHDDMKRRFGDTLPLSDVRKWFDDFAIDVWNAIEAMHV